MLFRSSSSNLGPADDSDSDFEEEYIDKNPIHPLYAQEKDEVFEAYCEYMRNALPHVVRTNTSEILWFCNRIPNDIPKMCPNCGAQLEFELQVQSTILDYLGIANNLEASFGILALFSCSAHCNGTFSSQLIRQKDFTADVKFRLTETA